MHLPSLSTDAVTAGRKLLTHNLSRIFWDVQLMVASTFRAINVVVSGTGEKKP